MLGKVTGVGHSGGEAYVKGLYAEHAYTAIDIRIDRIDSRRSRRFIKLRNPHGAGIMAGRMRAYKDTAGRLVPTAKWFGAESWIELSDFCDNFELSLGVGPQIHTPARQNLMKDLSGQLQQKKTALTPPKGLAPPH